MSYQTTITTKGQMTIPAAFRKKLGVLPGESVTVEMEDNKVIIQKNDWRANLKRVQESNRAHAIEHGIKPLNDEELDDAINQAAQQAAIERYNRSLDQ